MSKRDFARRVGNHSRQANCELGCRWGASDEPMTDSRAGDAKRDLGAAMIGKLLPELSTCLSLLLLATNPGGWLTPDPQLIYIALIAEGASLMFFCTLVDIATRVQRRPPWWVVVLIVGGVLLMYPDLIQVLGIAFEAGIWIFLPLVWSLIERIRELWTLPGAANEEKIRRRTLTFDRLWVGICIAGVAIPCAIGVAMLSEEGVGALARPFVPLGIGFAFYGVAAFNAWRVHQPAFAKRPSSLVPWLDRGDGTYLARL
jgi:hypothetical protein